MPTNTNPIGITFLPSAENQADGQRRGSLEGDLGQAFKILSLRLPRVQGVKAIAPPALLNSPGAAGVQGGFNPQAAIFEAIIRAMQGGGAPPFSTEPVDARPMGPTAPMPVNTPQPVPPPRIRPGDQPPDPSWQRNFSPPAAPAPPRIPFGGPKRTFSPAD